MNCRSFRDRDWCSFQTMEFLIERSFLKLVVDSENEFRRSLILRCCISEELGYNLDRTRPICMERSNIFLRKWDHFSRCNVDLRNITNYCLDQWRVVRKDRNKQITEFCENLIQFLLFWDFTTLMSDCHYDVILLQSDESLDV